jgi:hypothetical protein
MHIILLVVVGVLIAHLIMGASRNIGGGCLFVLILLLIIGSCAGHHTVVYHY